MKIALELQPCFGTRSGIGTYTLELAKRLCCSSDVQVQGNVFNFLRRNQLEDVLNQFPPDSIATNCTMPYGVYRRIWRALPLPYNVMFPKTDLCHFFNYIVPPRIQGTVVNTIHDMSYRLFPETLNPANLTRITRDIAYSVNRSQCIVTLSESSKQDILDAFPLDPNQVIIVPPAFEVCECYTSEVQMRSKFNINGPYILYLGNLEPRKNIERLIRALALLPRDTDISLVVAGQKGWLFDGIFSTVQQLGLEHRVIFTGYISAEEKSALYRNAALFAFPSLYEGFGIPILEAMSVGTPVLCGNTSSMPEVAGNAAVLVDPLSVEAIADGLYKLLSDKALRAEKIAAGYLQAAKFSWDDSAQKLLALYRSLL